MMTFFLTLLALAPLAFTGSGFFAYVSDKSFFIRTIITLVSVCFFIKLLTDESFRKKITAKAVFLFRDPIILSVGAYFLFFILSAVFAVDKFSAFFGTVERGEGMAGIVFFFGFSLYALLLFGKKEWLRFFKLSLAVAIVLFINVFVSMLIQISQGGGRPNSLLGNPSYLAAYLLFSVLTALVIYGDRSNKNYFWKTTALLVVVASVIGIFITGIRGAIVGLAAGIFATLFYSVFSNLKWKRRALALLIILFIFGGAFLITKDAGFWQKVPGFDRLTQISFEGSSSISLRFYSDKLAITAIDPAKNGYKKFLLGWGPENYVIAADKYYDPHEYASYESAFYDRAHNQILDIFVASGLLSVMAYFAIWFFVFRFLFLGYRGDRNSFTRSSLIFFGVAYFVQNLFTFDSLVTYIAFFAFLAFIVFLKNGQDKQ